jgi:uncharacterized tellurite resistance protein B-like protein
LLQRLIAALRDNAPPDSANPEQIWHKQVAVAALLVEACQVDRSVKTEECEAVARGIVRRFGLQPDLARQLVSAAAVQFGESLDDWVFTEAVRHGYDYADRLEIVGLLWDVVYADGALSALEDAMVHRVAAQLAISGEDLDAVRAEAFGRRSTSRHGGDTFRVD